MSKNMISSAVVWVAVGALAAGVALNAQAVPITVGGLPSLREATLDSAIEGFGGTGNATATDVDTCLPALEPWDEVGSVAPTSGGAGSYINGALTVMLTSGAWGSSGAAGGTWTINSASFWTDFQDAAISIHVGNGGGEYDHFVWHLEQGTSTGTWSYDGGTLGGGGLSNIKLYSSGTGTDVPDGGMTLAFLGAGVIGIALLRRRLG